MPRIEERHGKTKVVFYEREKKVFNETDRLMRLLVRNAESGAKIAAAANGVIGNLETVLKEARYSADPPTPLLDQAEKQSEPPAAQPQAAEQVTEGGKAGGEHVRDAGPDTTQSETIDDQPPIASDKLPRKVVKKAPKKPAAKKAEKKKQPASK